MSVCRYNPTMLQLFLPSALYKDLNSLWMEQIDCHFIITALSGTAAAIILLSVLHAIQHTFKKKIIAPINSSF